MVPKVFKEKGSDIYQFRMRYPDGVRRQKSTRLTHEGKAQKVAKAAYEAAELRRQGKEPEIPLGELVKRWCEKHVPPRKSPAYVAAMESWGRLHLGDLARLRPSALTTPLVEDALLVYLKDHAMSSANQWLAYLRVACKWAVRLEMMKTISWDVRKTKLQKAPKRLLPQRKTTPFLEAVDLLTQDTPAIAWAIQIMLGLGLRGSEARDARWEWFDAERATYTPGGTTKGLTSVARPVSEWLMALLLPQARAEGLMVPTQDGRRLTHGQIQSVMDEACRAVGVPRLTGHRLRGTYATLLAEDGVPMVDIMVVLGQKDIRTTDGYIERDMSRVIRAQQNVAEKTGLAGRKTGGAPQADPRQP